MKFSLICFMSTLVGGFLAMGLMGLGLYYGVSPVLNLHFPSVDTWHGDWVWPVFFLGGALWSFGFLISGLCCSPLQKRNWPKIALVGIYAGILWLWDLLIWFMILWYQPIDKLM